jgi:hypothetical protein
MYKPWEGKSELAKWAAVLAAVLGISIGLCGINYVADISVSSSLANTILAVTGAIELVGIIGSILGLILVAIIAIARSLFFKDPDRTE